jgi:membrane protein YqaA with SNARE-associated domain
VLFFLILVSKWIELLIRFGWAGIVVLGIVDASVLPLPGSLDLLTIVLAAHKHEYWLLYAIAAWVGSVGGGYLTYRIGQKGGKELLQKKVPKKSLQRVYKWMEGHSSLTLFLPTLLPPPTPVSYFVLAAGAMRISPRTFFLSFGPGRAIRYLLLAYFGTRYGRQIIAWARGNYSYILIGLLSLAALAGIIFAGWLLNRRRHRGDQHKSASSR